MICAWIKAMPARPEYNEKIKKLIANADQPF